MKAELGHHGEYFKITPKHFAKGNNNVFWGFT